MAPACPLLMSTCPLWTTRTLRSTSQYPPHCLWPWETRLFLVPRLPPGWGHGKCHGKARGQWPVCRVAEVGLFLGLQDSLCARGLHGCADSLWLRGLCSPAPPQPALTGPEVLGPWTLQAPPHNSLCRSQTKEHRLARLELRLLAWFCHDLPL